MGPGLSLVMLNVYHWDTVTTTVTVTDRHTHRHKDWIPIYVPLICVKVAYRNA